MKYRRIASREPERERGKGKEAKFVVLRVSRQEWGLERKCAPCVQERKEGSDAIQQRMQESLSNSTESRVCGQARVKGEQQTGKLLEQAAARWPLTQRGTGALGMERSSPRPGVDLLPWPSLERGPNWT